MARPPLRASWPKAGTGRCGSARTTPSSVSTARGCSASNRPNPATSLSAMSQHRWQCLTAACGSACASAVPITGRWSPAQPTARHRVCPQIARSPGSSSALPAGSGLAPQRACSCFRTFAGAVSAPNSAILTVSSATWRSIGAAPFGSPDPRWFSSCPQGLRVWLPLGPMGWALWRRCPTAVSGSRTTIQRHRPVIARFCSCCRPPQDNRCSWACGIGPIPGPASCSVTVMTASGQPVIAAASSACPVLPRCRAARHSPQQQAARAGGSLRHRARRERTSGRALLRG